MKVLFIATTPLCKDGLTGMLVRIAEIVREKHAVSFALAEPSQPELVQYLRTLGTVYELPSRKQQLFTYLRQLNRLLKETSFDYVHIHGNSATMAADLAVAWHRKVPRRITHTHNGAKQARWKQLILKRLVNWFVTDPVACSRLAGDLLYNRPYTVITNGIDCERFRFSASSGKAVREQLGIPEGAFVIGHIGRFTEQKNQGRLIRIFLKVSNLAPSAVLLLCGTGEDLEDCKALAEAFELQDRIVFAGETDQPEAYYSAMDVFVMPSLFEGLPLVGVEAQASGLPCVLSDAITTETRILEQTAFIPLSATDLDWAQLILSRTAGSREPGADLVRAAGFDQRETEQQILHLYGAGEQHEPGN